MYIFLTTWTVIRHTTTQWWVGFISNAFGIDRADSVLMERVVILYLCQVNSNWSYKHTYSWPLSVTIFLSKVIL